MAGISYDDYAHDMQELAQTGIAAVEMLQKRNRQMHFVLWAVLKIHGPTLIAKDVLERYGNEPVVLQESHCPITGGTIMGAIV